MHRRMGELLTNAGLSGNSGTSAVNGLAGPSVSGADDSQLVSTIQQATQQLDQLNTATQNNIDTVTANTDALTSGAQSQSSAGSSLLGSVSSAASGILGGGGLLGGLLGGGLIGDALSGIAGLFGGSSTPVQPTEYDAPLSQNFALATSNGVTGDDVDSASGTPRVAPVTELALGGVSNLSGTGSSSGSGESGSSGGSGNGGQGAPQITVNVQAMDSQSFMDRSADIAQAVRSAMLNMNAINDVIGDL